MGTGRRAQQRREQQFDLARLGIDFVIPPIDTDYNPTPDPDPKNTIKKPGATDDHPPELHHIPRWDSDTLDRVRIQRRLRKTPDDADGTGSTDTNTHIRVTDSVLDRVRLERRMRRIDTSQQAATGGTKINPIDKVPSMTDLDQDIATLERRLTHSTDSNDGGQHHSPLTDQAHDAARLERRLRRVAEEDQEEEEGLVHHNEGDPPPPDYDTVDEDYEKGLYAHPDDASASSGDAFAAGMAKAQRLWAIRRPKPAVPGPLAAKRVAQLPKHIPILTVLGMTVAMACAAGLGALPFFFVRKLSSHWSAIATAIACGVMFAASFDLIHEGQPYGPELVVAGIFLGGLFIKAMQRWLDGMENVHFGHLHGNRARRLVLMVGIMAAHAIGEGCGVGVSFCGERGWAQGVLTTLAIGVHNVPEGLAKATVLVSQGASAPEALFWSVVTCLPQPLVAVPSFLFVDTFTMLLPTALGFAAGCMIWMVFAELLPDALEGAKSSEVASAATLSAAALEGIRMGFEALEGPAGAFLPADFGVVGVWDRMMPAVASVAPSVVAAVAAAVVVTASSLPTPVVLGFTAVALVLAGGGAILHQIIIIDPVPLAHTACAALAGAVALLLFRRYALIMIVQGRAASVSGGTSTTNNGVIVKKRSTSVPRSIIKTTSDDDDATITGIAAEGLNGMGGGYSAATTHHRRTEGHYQPSQPDSPSKSRPAPRRGGKSHHNQNHRRRGALVEAPAQAVGLSVVAAALCAAAPLGLHYTRELAIADSRSFSVTLSHDMVPALCIASALHALGVGGAVRAAIGRSWSVAALVGLLLGSISAAFALLAYAFGPVSALDMVESLSYPQSWTETWAAGAGGALCTAALIQIAVAMHLQPRHARFGIVVGLLFFGVVGGGVAVGCGWKSVGCEVIHAVLQ